MELFWNGLHAACQAGLFYFHPKFTPEKLMDIWRIFVYFFLKENSKEVHSIIGLYAATQNTLDDVLFIYVFHKGNHTITTLDMGGNTLSVLEHSFFPWPRFEESAMTIRHLFRLFFLFFLLFLYQEVTLGKTNYHMVDIPQTPNIFQILDPL